MQTPPRTRALELAEKAEFRAVCLSPAARGHLGKEQNRVAIGLTTKKQPLVESWRNSQAHRSVWAVERFKGNTVPVEKSLESRAQLEDRGVGSQAVVLVPGLHERRAGGVLGLRATSDSKLWSGVAFGGTALRESLQRRLAHRETKHPEW